MARFPGVDPYIESQVWSTFHAAFLVALLDGINQRVRPRYVVRVDERVYIEHARDEDDLIMPDLTLLRPRDSKEQPGGSGGVAMAEPTIMPLPMPEEVRERYLTVRERETMQIVTVIELLSPSNKRRGSDGRREYLEKRESVLLSPVHLVEIDLLRGGDRMPVVGERPDGDYFAIVSRAHRRRHSAVYHWTLRDRLPTISLPLAHDDPESQIELQQVYTKAYDQAGFDYSLDYSAPLFPKPDAADADWIAKLLAP